MIIEKFVSQLNWKKLAGIVGIFAILLLIVHEIYFWRLFNETRQTMLAVNSQVIKQQQDIQKKISDSDIEFTKRGKKMDDLTTDIGELVNKEQADMAQYLDKAERDREERDKEFDKAFKEAPAQMMAQFQKNEDEMMKSYLQQSNQRQKEFQKHLGNHFNQAVKK